MRKRAAIDDEAPAPKRHHPDAVEQLVETIKFQQQQIEKATNIWVRLKGGEDRLGDANTMFLGLVKSAMYSGSLAVKLVEKQDDDIDEHDDEYLEERLHELEVSLTTKQDLEIDMLKGDMEQLVYETATEAADDLLFTERFAEAIGNAVTQDADVACNEEMVEIKKFVRGQMKMAKDAPETSQDVLREHEAEIGF